MSTSLHFRGHLASTSAHKPSWTFKAAPLGHWVPVRSMSSEGSRKRRETGATAAVSSRRGPAAVAPRGLVDDIDEIHRRAMDPRRQAKKAQYMKDWSNDVSSSGPVWNPFTAVLGVGAACTIMLALFAFFSYGSLWGISPGTRLY